MNLTPKKRGKISGVGVDIIELSRFRNIRHLSRVAEFVLTKAEHVRFTEHADGVSYLASRFAVKEAVIKASIIPLTYCDIEIVKEEKKPQVKLFGKIVPEIDVSISHSIDYVAGFAVAI